MEGNDQYSPLLIETQPGSYAMFLPPDMSVVKIFRKHLCKSLEENGFGREDIQQVELAADEALTNSIAANVSCKSEETIICRWMIKDMKLTLYILDYGSGFKPKHSSDSAPEPKPQNIQEYLDQIESHQATKSKSLPFQGVNVSHKNIGKGLKIIYSLMDSVKIFFHADGVVLENPEEGKVNGSIVELEYDLKKRSL